MGQEEAGETDSSRQRRRIANIKKRNRRKKRTRT